MYHAHPSRSDITITVTGSRNVSQLNPKSLTLSSQTPTSKPYPPPENPDCAQVKDAKFEEWSSAVEVLEYSSETPMGEVTAAWAKLSWVLRAYEGLHRSIEGAAQRSIRV